MRTATSVVPVLAVLLLLFLPLIAGCLTIPGPERVQKTPAVTTPGISHPTAIVTPVKNPKVPAATPSPAITTPQIGYASKTCPQQGGTEISPGQQCQGTWLAATDTFSCCSVKPVPVGGGNETVAGTPFTLLVNLDDSPGSITP